MRRVLALFVSTALVIAACGDDGVLSSDQATVPPTTSGPTTVTDGTTTTTTAVTTTAEVTTTEATTTTAVTTTTTTVPAPTTTTLPTNPVLPVVMSAGQIPWGQVDRSWAAVLYSTAVGYLDTTPPGEEFVALLLVAPDGTPYAAAHWPPETAPQRILDVRPDGRRAFLRFEGSLGLLDLTTGSMLPLPVPADSRHATFTRPTGRDYVALSPTGVIGLYGGNGALLRTLGEYQDEIYDFGIPLRPWLYGPSGLDLVINAPAGPTLVGNRGEHIRDLDRPGTDCRAMSWWTDTEVLVRCLNPRPGWPDAFTLWIVDAGGRAAPQSLATADHADPGAGHDGYVDGIRAGNTALIQGFLAVGSGWYPTYRAEPPSNPIPLGEPVAGQLVAATSTTIMVWQLGCCGVIWGGLSIYGLDGTEVALLDAPEGVFGVIDANGVGGH